MVEEYEAEFERTVIQQILELETNSGRFESVCNAIVSSLEGGQPVVGTSLSWDLGRDGVGLGAATGIYVCCSLRDDVDSKMLDDIERIASTTKNIKRLYFCSSHTLSEHRRTQIEEQLQRETEHKFPVTCLGAGQLAALSGEARTILQRNYRAEIAGVHRAIRSDPDDDTEISGLRLALISASADDTASIRAQLYGSGLLDTLRGGEKKTSTACGNALAATLKLGRSLPPETVQPHIQRLVSDGFVHSDGTLYWISERGIERLRTIEREAAGRLLSGQVAIRTALEAAIGSRLTEEHFQRIWSQLEERMAHYFLSRGFAIVAEISALLNSDKQQSVSKTPTPMEWLSGLADAIGNTSAHAQQRAELSQAVRDLFTDRTGPAAEWLVRICSSFIAACALGLEHTSGAALARLLARTTLVLDTDVILSLLGEGEPEHAAVEAIVSRWTKNGGKVIVAEPVLEECAYHAHISERDFVQVRHLIPGSAVDRLHIVENVFVRSFAQLLSENKARLQDWRAYIRQYSGRAPHDWQNINSNLAAEYSIGKLPPRSTADAGLERDVQQFLTAQLQARGSASKNDLDKARRDAQLYVALVGYVRSLRSSDPGATCLLVSSARRLAIAEAEFRESGEPQLVITISSVLYLVSLLPSASLGLSAMKSFLFDERRPGFSSDLERSLLRLVKASRELSMPFAKRGLLMRAVRDRMIEDAQAQGLDRTVRDLERTALDPANEQRTIQILKESLDSIAVDVRLEKENAELRAKLKELEARIERQRKST